MAYAFYIDGLRLPIAPSKLEMKIKNKNKTSVLLNEGEINQLKAPGLTEISFDVLLPQTGYPFAVYPNGFKTPEYFLSKLEFLKVNKSVFQFIVSRISPAGELLFGTNIKVSIEDYTITEDAKTYGLDVSVKIKLKQYRSYGVKTLSINEDGDTATVINPRAAKETSSYYIVQNNESLWEICKRELGDGELYSTVMELNNIPNPNDITPGQVLQLV